MAKRDFGCMLTLCILSQVRGKYELEFKNNEKKLSDCLISYWPPTDGRSWKSEGCSRSEMLRDAVTQLLNTEGF